MQRRFSSLGASSYCSRHCLWYILKLSNLIKKSFIDIKAYVDEIWSSFNNELTPSKEFSIQTENDKNVIIWNLTQWTFGMHFDASQQSRNSVYRGQRSKYHFTHSSIRKFFSIKYSRMPKNAFFPHHSMWNKVFCNFLDNFSVKKQKKNEFLFKQKKYWSFTVQICSKLFNSTTDFTVHPPIFVILVTATNFPRIFTKNLFKFSTHFHEIFSFFLQITGCRKSDSILFFITS